MDGDEARDGNEDADALSEPHGNRHLPDFDFNGYPLLAEEDDAMNSPRIKDEVWGNYQSQCEDEAGASTLRQNP